MRYDVSVCGPDVDGFHVATVVTWGVLVATEARRDVDAAKRAALRIVAERPDVTEIFVSVATKAT